MILNSLAESRTLSLEEKVCSMHTLHLISGTVYVQSLPFSRLADRIIASAPKAGGIARDEEGNLLGGLGEFIGWNEIVLKYH
jgi:hypothetical protein